MTSSEQPAEAPCECSKPRLVVTVNGYRFRAELIDPDEGPRCTGCGAQAHTSWRLGDCLDLPGACGQPKKNGEPCRWVITREPCPTHPSPDEQRRQDEYRQAEEVRRREAEEARKQETEERRLDLIEVLSVDCPHCSAPAASLCRTPKGLKSRPLHLARRQLAGVTVTKEYVVEATDFYTRRVEEASLDEDPRTVLNHPLEDRTEQARERYAAEQRAEAQRKLDKLNRDMWIADPANHARVTALPCPNCGAAPQERCRQSGWPHNRLHPERTDAAMAAVAPDVVTN